MINSNLDHTEHVARMVDKKRQTALLDLVCKRQKSKVIKSLVFSPVLIFIAIDRGLTGFANQGEILL